MKQLLIRIAWYYYSLELRALGTSTSQIPLYLGNIHDYLFLKGLQYLPLLPCAEAALLDKMVDPFLHLVQDGKLQAVNPGSVRASKAYGSKEDDECALKTLSRIKIDEEHTRESFATIIVKSLEDLSESESSILREQLVLEFVPEDVGTIRFELYDSTINHIHMSIDGNK